MWGWGWPPVTVTPRIRNPKQRAQPYTVPSVPPSCRALEASASFKRLVDDDLKAALALYGASTRCAA